MRRALRMLIIGCLVGLMAVDPAMACRWFHRRACYRPCYPVYQAPSCNVYYGYSYAAPPYTSPGIPVQPQRSNRPEMTPTPTFDEPAPPTDLPPADGAQASPSDQPNAFPPLPPTPPADTPEPMLQPEVDPLPEDQPADEPPIFDPPPVEQPAAQPPAFDDIPPADVAVPPADDADPPVDLDEVLSPAPEPAGDRPPVEEPAADEPFDFGELFPQEPAAQPPADAPVPPEQEPPAEEAAEEAAQPQPPEQPAEEAPVEEAPVEEEPAIDFGNLFGPEGDDADGAAEQPAPEDQSTAAPTEDPQAVMSVAGGLASEALRLWTDNSGTFSCRGRLTQLLDGQVRLMKDNGRTTTVPLSRLSEADLRFVQAQASAAKLTLVARTASN